MPASGCFRGSDARYMLYWRLTEVYRECYHGGGCFKVNPFRKEAQYQDRDQRHWARSTGQVSLRQKQKGYS